MPDFYQNIYGETMVTLTRDQYEDLVEDSTFLECLEFYGVANWQGYADAIKEFDERNDGERD